MAMLQRMHRSGLALLDNDLVSVSGGPTPYKAATISASASRATELVTAISGSKIRVINYTLVVNGAVNIKFQTASTDITGLLRHAAAGEGVSSNAAPAWLFETVAGEALNINLSGAVAIGGHLLYVEV